MWLNIFNLQLFHTLFIQKYLSFTRWHLTAHLLDCILVLTQALSKKGAFEGVKGGFISFTYLKLALDGGGTEFQFGLTVE